MTILTTATYGQEAKTIDKNFGISIGYIRQKDNFITIGGIIGKNVGNIHVPGWSYGLATEFNLHKDNSIVGVKAFFDYNLILFGARLNTISYFKGTATDFRLTPEIGFNMFGLCNIYYGYNIPIAGTEINELSRNRLNITLNLYRQMIKGRSKN